MAIYDGGEKFVCSRLLMRTDLNWGRSYTTAGQESEGLNTTQDVVLFGHGLKAILDTTAV